VDSSTANKNTKEIKRTDQNGKRPGNGYGRRDKRTTDMVGTWNICGLADKEPELIGFMERRGLSILGTTKEPNMELVLFYIQIKQSV